MLTAIQLSWALWLTMLITGATSCRGSVCTLVTLDGRVTLLLVCSLVSLSGLLALTAATRGLSSADCRETVSLTCAVLAGGTALLGVVALLCVVAVVLVTFAVLFGTMTVTP